MPPSSRICARWVCARSTSGTIGRIESCCSAPVTLARCRVRRACSRTTCSGRARAIRPRRPRRFFRLRGSRKLGSPLRHSVARSAARQCPHQAEHLKHMGNRWTTLRSWNPKRRDEVDEPKGALHGLRVIDLTRVLAGPFSTMMLADMGAEVIKVEQPGKGDDTRHFAPFQNGESAYYMNLNRGKKGVTLDLKGGGREIFLELIRKADVVVENFRPGTMEKLGLGYETLKAANPRLVYAAVSGFGDTGPYRLRPGYDIIAQAMGGLMSTTGWPGGEPTRSGTAMADVLAGLSVTIGILAALRHRDQSGEGQKVDVALVDSVVASLEIITQIYLADGRVPERIGNRYESCYPYDSFAARDGSVVIAAANDKLWRLVCRTIDRPTLADDERFDANAKRVERHAEIKLLIEAWTRTRNIDHVVEK